MSDHERLKVHLRSFVHLVNKFRADHGLELRETIEVCHNATMYLIENEAVPARRLAFIGQDVMNRLVKTIRI